jgi:serine protease Do
MKRTGAWIKFGGLVVVTAVLAVAFTSILDLPTASAAQQPRPTSFLSAAVPQQRVITQAQSLEELGSAFTEIAEAVRPTVVYVDGEARQQTQRSTDPFGIFRNQPRSQRLCGDGSGFIISQDGYILTNNHVVQDCDRVSVRLFDQRIIQRATIVGRDRLTDVAVLKVEEEDLPFIGLGDSDSVSVGEWVVAVGNPLGDAFSFTVTAGIVSGRGRRLDGLRDQNDPAFGLTIHDFIQTDAAINRGNSGGPLVNIRGEVIGINSAIASETGYYSGYGFAIPINLARNVADQLIASGRVTRAQLGVSIDEVNQEVADYVGLDEIRGVLLLRFNGENTPAEQAGLRPNDVIVELDGQEVQYVAQLQQIVGFKRPGDFVEVTVLRKGGEQSNHRVRLSEANTDREPTMASSEPEESDGVGSSVERLGISVEPLDRRSASQMRLPRGIEPGLAVMSVDEDGPADGKLAPSSPTAGRLEIITHVDERRVETVDDLEDALRRVPPGEVVLVQSVLIFGDGNVNDRPVFIRTQGGR